MNVLKNLMIASLWQFVLFIAVFISTLFSYIYFFWCCKICSRNSLKEPQHFFLSKAQFFQHFLFNFKPILQSIFPTMLLLLLSFCRIRSCIEIFYRYAIYFIFMDFAGLKIVIFRPYISELVSWRINFPWSF